MYVQRPVITSLDLSTVHTIARLLVNAFDFSRLAHFKSCFRFCNGVKEMLHASKVTIQSLDFPGSGMWPHFPLLSLLV